MAKIITNASSNVSELVTTVSTSSSDMSILSLVLSSDATGKMVMLLLVVFSIISWAIIIEKILQYKSIKRKIAEFENLFWSGQVLDDLYSRLKKNINNPLTSIFIGAMDESKKTSLTTASNSTIHNQIKIGQKERINQAMNLAKNRYIEQIESRLTFLATIGSSSPFIGLFGTVWGIMHSFQSIAVSKNTSLAVVAPGIAESLLATALGLFAAIPAVIFYNHLQTELDKIYNKSEDFSGELKCLLFRAIDEEKLH
jgi:biopolymer transport protein TolQ